MSKSTTAGQHSFAQIPTVSIERSTFDRSCGYKTTFDGGYLIPVYCDEGLPGDTHNLKMHNFTRLATPLHPIMDNMKLTSFFFSIPIRLIWDNFQKMNGEQKNPGDTTDFTVPQTSAPGSGYQSGDLADYMGIPIKTPFLQHSALWMRAYNLVYNEWFRDENLCEAAPVPTGDADDDWTNYKVLRRMKRHDYFTSSLPWPQKGDTVNLPLLGTAPIIPDPSDAVPLFKSDSGSQVTPLQANGSSDVQWQTTLGAGEVEFTSSGLIADLNNASAGTINDLREAFQIQRMFERDARGGTRYTEILRSHFKVVSPDQRLQRPEYLGGGTQTINITPVPQTSQTDTAGPDPSPQGNLAAYGTSTGSNHGYNHSFDEHCIVIGIIHVGADLNYQQGLERQWSRESRFDFFWPALAHLGEQEIKNKEIYAVGSVDPDQDDATFGYQERYAEYRYKPSLITGQFRSTHSTSLDTWHLAQEFTELPLLNQSFMEDTPPIDRIIAVDSEPHFLFDAFFKIRSARPMPMYGVPGMIDHF